MESLGSLAGGIAHDFNNLLTGMLGYAELAQMRLPADSTIQADLEEIRKSAERAATLTKQLLTFARKEVVEPQVVDIDELVAGLANLISRLLGVDIELAIHRTDVIGMVRLDPSQFEQVLINLSVNARDAMPKGGKLTIATQNKVLAEGYQTHGSALRPGSYVVLSVQDTGCGMSKETQAQAFDPFFTTKAKGKGTGLGLSTCYGIITGNNGHIWVYSELGVGTTFRIYFPRVDEAALSQTPLDRAPAPGHGETILVVDDEDSIRSLAVATLTTNGYRVLEAASGREALNLAANYKDRIDLLITDMIMPGMTGRELSEVFAIVRADLKVLFMSGYTDDAILHQGALTRAFSFLQKPFSVNQLSQKVREVLDRPTDPAGAPS
jgi:CheY-like chemotaxis protein